jgi:hypothetical protein
MNGSYKPTSGIVRAYRLYIVALLSKGERWTVLCGQCGNNACNGGTGEVMGREHGTTMPCPACESAYQMDMTETPPPELFNNP